MTVTDTTQTSGAPLEHFVETRGRRIHVVEAGSGHPVVLLHGGGPGATGWSNFAPNIQPLAEHFRVLAPSMPGWGESETSDGGGLNHTDDLIDLLDALDIEKAALMGNSVGGITAITTAINHPERVSHLVTMGAPSPFPPMIAPGGMSEGMKALTAGYQNPSRETVKAFIDIMCFDPNFATEELIESRLAAALAHPEHLTAWISARAKVGGVAPYFTLGPKLSTITAPTMIIQGRDDRTAPLENALALTARIPNSRMVMINRCGHWVQLEHAEEFNRIVTSFVQAS